MFVRHGMGLSLSPLFADIERTLRDLDRVDHRWSSKRTSDGVTMKASLPGVPRDHIHIDVENRTLRVSVDADAAEERAAFARRFELPEDLDASAIRATAKDGVLTIVVPHKAVDAPVRTTIMVQPA
jgi:HSP20 family molecular chaperone IbpA